MTDQTEVPYVPSDELIAEIRARVTGTCGCCGYDVHDFETADVLTLMDEVDRARTECASLRAEAAAAYARMGKARENEAARGDDVVTALRQRVAATARADAAEAEIRRLRALIADEHSRLSQDFDNAEEVARLRAELAAFKHEVQWAHQVVNVDGTWAGDAVVQADEQAAHASAGIVARAIDPATDRVDVVCRDVWIRATDWRKADAKVAGDE
jgi:hypothetical protein